MADGFGDAQEDLKGRDAREKIEGDLIGSLFSLREKGKDVIHSFLMVSSDLPDQTFGIVNLFSMAWKEEVTEVLEPGMAWAMADHKAMELAKHSAAEQQRLKINSESKGKKKGMWSPSNSNAPMEVDAKGRGKGKAESVEVSDDEDEW